MERQAVMDMAVLYLDNHLLAVVKPSNLPVQRDRSGDEDALSMAKGFIGEKFHKPGDVYLGLVHRLDRPVGGVLLFARTSKAAARLSAQFAENAADKRYVAVVQGTLTGSGALTDYLLKDESTGTVRVAAADTPGAKEARLRYRAISTKDDMTLVDVRLETGRPHQIRVQLHNAGHPILCDARYGAAVPGTPIALWAYYLAVAHPTLKEPISFSSPAPNRAPFTAFGAELEALYEGT